MEGADIGLPQEDEPIRVRRRDRKQRDEDSGTGYAGGLSTFLLTVVSIL